MNNSIPAFIDTNSLVINRTHTSRKDGTTQELGAADAQGDTITLTKWTEDVGACAVVPDSRLSVAYQEKDHEPLKKNHIGGDEAYDLYRALKGADQADNLDNMTIGFLIHDLGRAGGAGGGAC
ncbi:MAG: hypothetical protein HY319_16930 [Armatimonadetes bacterium]|nr:hypothetical protein [Armatimonadota bacterium]